MKIIDSFLFHNEFDMLKLRLEYLRDFVDYFVIRGVICDVEQAIFVFDHD